MVWNFSDLPLISRETVALKLKGIDLSKSPGPFDPPMKIVKYFAEQLSVPLTDIINSSFQDKCFGDIWKAYYICPITKTNPCTTVENIMPNALTSVFSKIQESFALDWMLEDSKNKISKCQFGGISWSSAVLALLEMLHTWFSALENPQTVMRIIFLDFPRAFDLIVHNILLSNFKSIGALPALYHGSPIAHRGQNLSVLCLVYQKYQHRCTTREQNWTARICCEDQ